MDQPPTKKQVLVIEPVCTMFLELSRQFTIMLPGYNIAVESNVDDGVKLAANMDPDVVVLGVEVSDPAHGGRGEIDRICEKLDCLTEPCAKAKFILFANCDLKDPRLMVNRVVQRPSIGDLAYEIVCLLSEAAA